MIKNGLEAFSNTNGLGLGSGGAVANQEIIGPVDGRFTSMHNFWVELLVEGGVLTAIILFIWYVSVVYNLYKSSKKTNSESLKYYSQSLFLSMASFIPAAVAASSTVYFFPMWIMFGLSVSVIHLSKGLILQSKSLNSA